MNRPVTPLVASTCAHCSEVFWQKPWRGHVFCSRKCTNASGRAGRKSGPTFTVTCATCGADFLRRACEMNDPDAKTAHAGTYCSRSCFLKPKLSTDEARRRAYAATSRWRKENAEHVSAYKRATYRRGETSDGETRQYVDAILGDPCVYCGGRADSIDHIQPVSKGGRNHWSNIAPACRSCNSGKKDRDLLTYMTRRLCADAP